jgi:hypothetical protein
VYLLTPLWKGSEVWGFGGGIGSRGDSASQVATLSPHVFPCTSTGLSSNRASDPLSLKLAQTPADSLHAGMLAGCGGVHGIGGTRRGAGDGFRFSYIEIPPPAPQFAGVQPVERRTLFMRRSLLSCAVRRAPPSLRGSLHAEPNSFYFARRHDCRLAPAPGRRYAAAVRPASTKPNNADTSVQYTARPARHGDTIGAMVRDVLYEVSLSRGNYSSTTVVYKQCC